MPCIMTLKTARRLLQSSHKYLSVKSYGRLHLFAMMVRLTYVYVIFKTFKVSQFNICLIPFQGPRGIFQSCSYKSKTVQCGDIFKETITDVGVCCSLRDSSNDGKLNPVALLGLYDNTGQPSFGKFF